MRAILIGLLWTTVTGGVAGYLALDAEGEERKLLLPGDTTSAHYQIVEQCELCHTDGGGVAQSACAACHEDELWRMDNSHPMAKFLDPRNHAEVSILDARKCITCHTEHQPNATSTGAVTQPRDHCAACHADIAEERPSHRGLEFASCQNVGCHNFHDNRATAAAFLRAHANEPDLLADPRVPERTMYTYIASSVSTIKTMYTYIDRTDSGGQTMYTYTAEGRAPDWQGSEHARTQWALSAHARGGVGCADCHQREDTWRKNPSDAACRDCHQTATDGFFRGRHGMRAAHDLSPMSPADARLVMADDAPTEVTCTSCHGPHETSTRRAAVAACLGCHADDHSRAYLDSPHHAAWKRELAGLAPPRTGVSCATCHLPRRVAYRDGLPEVVVTHNQSLTMRPREKMIRPVCSSCHGLGFAIDALADDALVDRNFRGQPERHVEAIDMAMRADNE